MKIFKDKINELHKIYDYILEYVNISETLKPTIKISINDVEKLFKHFDKIEVDTNFKDIKHLFDVSHTVEYILYELETILKYIEDDFHYGNNINNTSYSKLYNTIYVRLSGYRSQNADSCDNIINSITDSLDWDKSNEINKFIQTMNEYIKKYIYAVPIYAIIIQHLINQCNSKNIKPCNNIFIEVESIKNTIFNNVTDDKYKETTLVYNNPRLSTYGLTPIDSSHTLVDIIKLILNCKISTIKDLQKIANSNKVCIIVLNNIIKNPIEFDFWKLISWDIAKPYIQSNSYGLNKKFINRFTTIKFLDTPKQKWNFKMEYYGDIKSNEFYILENIGGIYYRQLSIYNYDENFNKLDNNKPINRDRIIELITNLSTKKISTKTRMSEYHNIHEDIIMSNMFLPVIVNTINLGIKSQVIDIVLLKYTILTTLTTTYLDIIKRDFKNGKTIKSIIDIGKIIHSDNLVNTFIDTFIKQYYEYSNILGSDIFAHSDVFKTLLANIRLTHRIFIREMHDTYKSIPIDINIFNMDETKKLKTISSIIETIIIKVLDKIISNSNNIYQHLIYKTELMKLDLV